MKLKESIDQAVPDLEDILKDIATDAVQEQQTHHREPIKRITTAEWQTKCTCGHLERYHIKPAIPGSNRGLVCKFASCQCKGFLIRASSTKETK